MMTMMTNRISLYSLFRSLQEQERNESAYNVINICEAFPHKLGCSFTGMPIFFVECSTHEKITDIKLDIVSVIFNCRCQITEVEAGTSTVSVYSIIQLNSENKEITNYFLEVIYLVLRKLPPKPSISELRSELIKVISLFSNPAPFSKDIVRGLWAELLVIDQSTDPDYMVKSWHVSPEDKFDFNDGNDKIEIKSTSNQTRAHVFSLEQLNPNSGSKLLIGSVFAVQSGGGKTIFDLADNINIRLKDLSNSLKLKDIILQTIGANISQVEKIYFDYTLGIQSKCFFSADTVPSIPTSSVPNEVTNVHFRSDLTSCEPYKISASDCVLFKSVGL